MPMFVTEGVFVTELELPEETVDHARAMAGEKAVALSADRMKILNECAAKIEKLAGTLFWDGVGNTARRTTSVIDLPVLPVPLDACPVFPHTVGADVTLVSVESWDDGAAAWVTFNSTLYKVRPGGRIQIPRHAISVSHDSSLSLRIIADILPLDPRPLEADEALARLFAMRENWRPRGTSRDEDGRILNLDNAARRSGALEVLDSLRTSWPI